MHRFRISTPTSTLVLYYGYNDAGHKSWSGGCKNRYEHTNIPPHAVYVCFIMGERTTSDTAPGIVSLRPAALGIVSLRAAECCRGGGVTISDDVEGAFG